MRRSPAYFVLLLLAAADAAGYSVIGPVLPAIARRTGAGPGLVGVLASMFPVAMLLGFVVAGGLVRRGHLRVTLTVSILVAAAGAALFALPSTLPMLFLARAAMGLGSGGIWIGVTLGALAYWPADGYRAMARILAAYSVGTVLGPALGALGGIALPFLAYAVLLLALLPVAVWLPDPGPRTYVPDRSALRTRAFWAATLAVTLAMSAFGLLDGVLPLHLGTQMSQGEIGVAYVGVALLVGVASVHASRFRPWPVVLAGAVAVVAGITLAGGVGVVAVWLVALAAVGVGAGYGETGATGLLLETSSTDRIVTPMVVWSQVAMVGYLAGPAVGGVLAEQRGYAALGLIPLALLAAVVVLRPGARRQS
jgi:ACDE family multidrug resistance protein